MINTIQAAFLAGLADRIAGLPMIVRTADIPDLNDAYGAGYDPYNEMDMVLPEFVEQQKLFVARMIRQCCPTGIPTKLPRNKCEFSSAE